MVDFTCGDGIVNISDKPKKEVKRMEHYLVIDDDASVYKVKPSFNKLADLQTLVGGYIECVRVTPEIDAWVNEEGLIKGDFVFNLLGSFVVNCESQYKGHHLVGPVVFTTHDEEGNTLPVPEAWSKKQTAEMDVFGNGEILSVNTCVSAMLAMRERV